MSIAILNQANSRYLEYSEQAWYISEWRSITVGNKEKAKKFQNELFHMVKLYITANENKTFFLSNEYFSM